jgi:hypothetical protein
LLLDPDPLEPDSLDAEELDPELEELDAEDADEFEPEFELLRLGAPGSKRVPPHPSI